MSLLIDTLLELIRNEYKKEELEWKISSQMTESNKRDWEYLWNECKKDSEFDPMNIRMNMLNEMLKGKLELNVARCEYGQVIVIYENGINKKDIPWGLWGRILRLYSNKNNNKKFKIYLLANSNKRVFPNRNKKITPQNINGGYTYSCNLETIIIYRAEDATRVLLHELQHSCCLDDKNKNVDDIEAETEAWAELIYIGLLSKGNIREFNLLLKNQIDWIINQNHKIKEYMVNPNSNEFPWRYTIGKEEVWRKWGLIRDINSDKKEEINSLRLTKPPTDKFKIEMKIRKTSIIL